MRLQRFPSVGSRMSPGPCTCRGWSYTPLLLSGAPVLHEAPSSFFAPRRSVGVHSAVTRLNHVQFPHLRVWTCLPALPEALYLGISPAPYLRQGTDSLGTSLWTQHRFQTPLCLLIQYRSLVRLLSSVLCCFLFSYLRPLAASMFRGHLLAMP